MSYLSCKLLLPLNDTKYFLKLRFGDGKNCLPNGVPQRVNGVVGGTINSVSVVEQSLHCYVVTADGRTYTAISRYAVTYLIFTFIVYITSKNITRYYMKLSIFFILLGLILR